MWNCSVIVTTYNLRQIRARNIIRKFQSPVLSPGHRSESLLFKHLQTRFQNLTPHLCSSYLLLCNKPPQIWYFLTMHLVTTIWLIKFTRLPISGNSTALCSSCPQWHTSFLMPIDVYWCLFDVYCQITSLKGLYRFVKQFISLESCT